MAAKPDPATIIGHTAPLVHNASGIVYSSTQSVTEAIGAVASAGYVVGPASSTDTAIPKYNGTTGKLIQNTGVLIRSDNSVMIPGVALVNFNNGATTFGDDGGLILTSTGGVFAFCNSGNVSFTADSGDVLFTGNNGFFTVGTLDLSCKVKIKTSGNASIAKVGGSIFGNKTDVSNSGTSETDIYTDTLPSNCIVNVFDKIYARYGGIFSGAAASTQQVRAYFGGNLIFDSGALAIGVATPAWDLELNIMTESNVVIRCVATFHSASTTLAVTTQYTRVTGLTLSSTNILKITGTAGGASGASTQITGKQYYVEWKPSQ